MLKITEETELRPTTVETRDEQAHCHNVEAVSDGDLWFHDIKIFLKDDSYPDSVNSIDKRTLRKLDSCFFLNGEICREDSMTGSC